MLISINFDGKVFFQEKTKRAASQKRIQLKKIIAHQNYALT